MKCSPVASDAPLVEFLKATQLTSLFFHCGATEMSCLMEALQDKRVRLQPECKKRLQDRIDMWSYAAKVRDDPPT